MVKKFGIRLAEERRTKNLSQVKLAKLAGIDRSYLSGIERGVRNPSLNNIFKISTALKIDPYLLFK